MRLGPVLMPWGWPRFKIGFACRVRPSPLGQAHSPRCPGLITLGGPLETLGASLETLNKARDSRQQRSGCPRLPNAAQDWPELT